MRLVNKTEETLVYSLSDHLPTWYQLHVVETHRYLLLRRVCAEYFLSSLARQIPLSQIAPKSLARIEASRTLLDYALQ